jgi:hypothetical protein
MYFLIFVYLVGCDIIHHEDRIFKNNSFTYYTKENRKCTIHTDCQTDWCTSGSRCSKEGYCLKLQDYPCPHTMKCNSRKRICENITCFTRYECNDLLYCNGYELCEDRICKRTKHPCSYGTCIEANKSCLYNENTVVAKDIIKTSSLEMNENDDNKLIYANFISVNLTDDDIRIQLTGDALWDSNSIGFQVAFLVIVIVLFILVFGLCFIVMCCMKRK